MYDPPTKKNWVRTGRFSKEHRIAYDKGYEDAKAGKQYLNPYKESGHERDTTFEDELNYYYYVGYYDENDKE